MNSSIWGHIYQSFMCWILNLTIWFEQQQHQSFWLYFIVLWNDFKYSVLMLIYMQFFVSFQTRILKVYLSSFKQLVITTELKGKRTKIVMGLSVSWLSFKTQSYHHVRRPLKICNLESEFSRSLNLIYFAYDLMRPIFILKIIRLFVRRDPCVPKRSRASSSVL